MMFNGRLLRATLVAVALIGGAAGFLPLANAPAIEKAIEGPQSTAGGERLRRSMPTADSSKSRNRPNGAPQAEAAPRPPAVKRGPNGPGATMNAAPGTAATDPGLIF